MLAEKLLGVAAIGGTLVLYLLIGLSVLSIGLIVERWLWFRARKVDARRLGRQLLEKLRAGDRAGAAALVKDTRHLEGQVIDEALGWLDDGPDAVAQVIDTAWKEKRREAEAGLNFLGTLGNNAPFIGLFGTVLGVVTAFRELGAATAGAANGMGNVMSGIAEALVATAIGILVALPAVVFYNVFQKGVNAIEDNVGSIGGLLLAHLKSTRAPASARHGHHEHAKLEVIS